MAIDYTWNRIKDAASGLEPIVKYKIAQDAAAKAAAVAERDKLIAVEQWGAERRTGALKVALDHHATRLNSIGDAIGTGEFDLGDPTNLGIYTQAFSNFNKTQKDYYESVGIPSTGDTITHLTPFFSSIFDDWDKKNPDGDPATLKWGKENGVWGDVINKLDPDISRDDAHAVWEKIWKSKFGDGKKEKSLSIGESFPMTGKGQAAEVLGLLPDVATGLLNAPGAVIEGAMEGASGWWTGKDVDVDPLYRLTDPFMGREWWKKAFNDPRGSRVGSLNPFSSGQDITDKPTTAPSGEYFGTGIIGGGTDMMKREADAAKAQALAALGSKSQSVETLDETLKSLEKMESDAQERSVGDSGTGSGGGGGRSMDRGQDISQEASLFLAKLLEYMRIYTEDQARDLLAQDFSDLSNSAKNELQSYLITESEALA